MLSRMPFIIGLLQNYKRWQFTVKFDASFK